MFAFSGLSSHRLPVGIKKPGDTHHITIRPPFAAGAVGPVEDLIVVVGAGVKERWQA